LFKGLLASGFVLVATRGAVNGAEETFEVDLEFPLCAAVVTHFEIGGAGTDSLGTGSRRGVEETRAVGGCAPPFRFRFNPGKQAEGVEQGGRVEPILLSRGADPHNVGGKRVCILPGRTKDVAVARDKIDSGSLEACGAGETYEEPIDLTSCGVAVRKNILNAFVGFDALRFFLDGGAGRFIAEAADLLRAGVELLELNFWRVARNYGACDFLIEQTLLVQE